MPSAAPLRHNLAKVRGFTLLEAMVVVAILAILSTIAMPSFRTMVANQRVSSAATELQTLLLFARAEAVYRQSEILLTTIGQRWVVTHADATLRETALPQTISVHPTTSAIRFKANGTATATSIAVSTSAASRKECLRITGAGLIRLSRQTTLDACP